MEKEKDNGNANRRSLSSNNSQRGRSLSQERMHRPHTSFNSVGEFIEATLMFGQSAIFGSTRKELRTSFMIGVLLLFAFVINIVGLFVVLIPLTYQLGGVYMYQETGWAFWQPGVGGMRFVALNAAAWTLYGIALLFQISSLGLHDDPFLASIGFATGQVSLLLMVSALLVYQGPLFRRKKSRPLIEDMDKIKNQTFTDELVLEMLLKSRDMSPSALLWVFIGAQMMTTVAAFTLMLFGDFRIRNLYVKCAACTIALWIFSACAALTHALGGQWMHIGTSYRTFQPFRGGLMYVTLQILGWCIFGLSVSFGFLAYYQFYQIFESEQGKKNTNNQSNEENNTSIETKTSLFDFFSSLHYVMSISGLLGMSAEFIIAVSLLFYQDDHAPSDIPVGEKQSLLMKFMVATRFFGMNVVFGTPGIEHKRKISISSWKDYEKGDERFKRMSKKCKTTGDHYLVIGVGFVGRRLVQCLLDRGETRVRLFDISPSNPFKDDPRIEYVRGDVTNLDHILSACEGIDTVYCTFAIIRFMDRLEHQAALSYRINVVGTENVIKACEEKNVKRMVVTSSSHATTDEHSEPRFNRNESSPYVTRETAHNHYGWTKAIADQAALQANGMKTKNGGTLLVSIVRPCSGVFGGDDRVSFEKVMDLGIAPGVGATAVMDWIYVMNVVLGHLLCEHKLQVAPEGVAGEAFNVSNNEAISMEEFWWSTRNILHLFPAEMIRSRMEFVYLPMPPIWVVAYASEWVQHIWKGRISLGSDLDMLTPGTLATACMSYSYNSEKAKKFLDYEPAYTVDEAIAKSLVEYWNLKYPTQYNNKSKTN